MKKSVLEKILELKMAAWAVPLGMVVVVTTGSCLGLAAYNKYIEKNLEPCAINCKAKNNLIGFPDWKKNLPKIKNKDLDGNGKYESIIIYTNQEGKKVYQEIRKTDEGLMLTDPKLYK